MSLRYRSRRVEASFADVLRQAGPGIRLWIGQDGPAILHEGVAAVAAGEGSGRCQDVVRQARAQGVVHEGRGPGPVWLGGLAFDEASRSSGPWTDFPSARFCLPLRQWVWREGECLETRLEADTPDPVVTASAQAALPETLAQAAPSETRAQAAPSEAQAQAAPPETRAQAAIPKTLAQATPPETGAQAVQASADAFTCVDATAWARLVHDAQHEILAGRLTKVVAARVEELAPVSAREHVLALRQEAGTAFLLESGASTFYGCTPETLVRLHGNDVSTHALAGSADRSTDGDALLASGKDVLEHELVAAFVRERLVEAGVRDVRQEERRLRRLRHVQHLETPVHGSAPEGTHLLDLAASLHPTPAVCGTPRRRSLEWIREHEGWPRGWYAGAVGWFDADGQGELSVALRCALQRDNRRYAFAGAGIVAGSEASAERRETEAKLAAMREGP